jgi:hypothetical protein
MNKYRVLLPRGIRRGKSYELKAASARDAVLEVTRIFNLHVRELEVFLIAVDDTPVAIDTATLGE